jgi:hypothetical protein
MQCFKKPSETRLLSGVTNTTRGFPAANEPGGIWGHQECAANADMTLTTRRKMTAGIFIPRNRPAADSSLRTWLSKESFETSQACNTPVQPPIVSWWASKQLMHVRNQLREVCMAKGVARAGMSISYAIHT